MIDLHTHSTCSDGTLTPSELMRSAASVPLHSIALTDHDTVSGIEEARCAASDLNIELIPGIEFSTAFQGREIHIVGLDIDHRSPLLSRRLNALREERDERNRAIIRRMQQDGHAITEEGLQKRCGKAVLTRAHFARFLLEEGKVSSISEAFELYLGEGKCYYIPRQYTDAGDAVSLIRELKGIPVLAHPFQYHLTDSEMDALIRHLKSHGLVGIEVYYSTHTDIQTRQALHLAERFGLKSSGGSDFHGTIKPDIALGKGFGNLHIEDHILTNLRKANTL